MADALPIPERVLLIRPSALGDVIRTAPALTSLRAAWPRARIDWLVNDTLVAAAKHHPAVSNVVPFPRRSVARGLRRLDTRPARALAATLRAGRYDLAIDLQGLLRSGVLSLATGARTRVGYADAREMGCLGYTRHVHVTPGLHHIDRDLALLRTIGVSPVPDLRVYAGPSDAAEIDAHPRLAGARFAVLSPAARGLGRCWPVERFAALARSLLSHAPDLGLDTVAVVGLPDERDYCAPVTALAATDGRVVDLVGATSIGGLIALVERAALVVCNDSAAMHLAVALGRPLVALFGPTEVERAGPYGRPGDVITRRRADERVRHRDIAPSRALMERIGLGEVVEACTLRLSRSSARTPA